MDMLRQLENVFRVTAAEESTRAIILASTGTVFCAGHNLQEFAPGTPREQHVEIMRMCSEFMQLLPELPVPIIAQIEGLATAAGCQLVASCDLAIASESSRFMTPGVKIGLFCHTPGVALARTSMPSKQALNMLFTGDAMSAKDAL
eukprot:UC4_evm1s276